MLRITLKNGDETRVLIAKAGKSLRSFASSIGISHCYLSQVINNKRTPSPGVAHKIAKELGQEIDDIFLVKMVDKSTGKGNVTG